MQQESKQVCTYSEFTFESGRAAWQAFKNVGQGKDLFLNSKVGDAPHHGLQLLQPMGTGAGNGFSIWPDFKRYVFFGIWNTFNDAVHFFDNSSVLEWYRAHAASYLHLVLKPAKSHGKWSGSNPIKPAIGYSPDGTVAVLTRATIRMMKLPDFWWHVPTTSRYMASAPGKLYSLGVGEYPLFMQATFSLWESKDALQHAAYKHQAHAEVVRLTRQRNWYAEELFAQFGLLTLEQVGKDQLAAAVRLEKAFGASQ